MLRLLIKVRLKNYNTSLNCKQFQLIVTAQLTTLKDLFGKNYQPCKENNITKIQIYIHEKNGSSYIDHINLY